MPQFPPYLRCVTDGLSPGALKKKQFDVFEVWKKVSEIMSKSVFGLHRHGRFACTPFSKRGSKSALKTLCFLTFLETRFQDGRSGLQGVSKGCQRGAPGDPNVVPAVPDVAHGCLRADFSCHFVTPWRSFWALFGSK